MDIFLFLSIYQVYILFFLSLILPLLLSFLFLWIKCRRIHLPNRPPRGGLINRFRKERQLMFIDLIKQYGSTCELEDTLVTIDPTVAAILLTQKCHYEYRSRWYVNFSRFVLPGLHGILNMEGEEWKRHTEILGPLFATHNVARYGTTIANIAERHTTAWIQGKTASNSTLLYELENLPISSSSSLSSSIPSTSSSSLLLSQGYQYGGNNLLEAIRGMGTEIFLQWALGLDTITKNKNEQYLISKLTKDLANYGTLVAIMAQKPLMLLSIFYRLYQCTKAIQNDIQLLANRAKINMEERKLCILQGKLDSLPPEDAIIRMVSAGFTLEETAAEINHIHGAHKADTFVLTHLLHDLCQPSSLSTSTSTLNLCQVGGQWWRNRLREEWQENLSNSRPPTRIDLSRSGSLPLTTAILEECERLHPVSLGVVRQTGTPLQIDNILLPSNIENVILLWGIHMHPAIWMYPNEFHPHRWLTKVQIQTICERAERYQSKNTIISINSVDTNRHLYRIDGKSVDIHIGPDMIGTAIEASLNSSTIVNNNIPTKFERFPAWLDIDEALRNPDKRRVVPPFAHIPFLRGGRLCAGKELARLELAILLHGILSRLDIQTDVEYLGHIKGIPIGIGKGHKVSRQDLPDDMVIQSNYTGPLSLLLADDMYTRIDGDIPFYIKLLPKRL